MERRERRREMWEDARRYPYRGGYYYWGGGYWWWPYYDGDDVVYVEVYPEAGFAVEELPEGYEELITEDGVYYEANGVYYRRAEDGSFATVDAPDSGNPDPITLMRRACEFVMRQDAFTLTASDTMDHVQDSGQKLQTGCSRTFHVSRPNKLAGSARGDNIDRGFWYDGGTLTIVDHIEKVYAETPAPDDTDAMIDLAVTQLSLSLPLIDFLYSDPYSVLYGAMEGGEYLGVMDVGGTICHHLSFSTTGADWQVWVDAGEQPAPRMLAITYTGAPESPTYIAQMDAWDLAPGFTAETFKAVIPDGLEKISFTTPESEIKRLEDELERLREKNRRVDEYIASERTIKLYSQIAEKPEAAKIIETEQAKLEKIGEVSQEEIDDYLRRRKELRDELAAAKRAARD